jgi:hypothetical protein
LFSGSVYGGVFDRKNEGGVFTCRIKLHFSSTLYSVDMKEKTITKFSKYGGVIRIYKIVEENEVIVKGKGRRKKNHIT